MNRDFKQLRKFLDGDDPFMVGGHQLSDIRKRTRPVPEWTRNNGRIREILLTSFPNLKTDARQRRGAARWAIVIHLYFRLQYTRVQTAAELDASPESVKNVIRSIKRVSEGRRADGQGRLQGGRWPKHAPIS